MEAGPFMVMELVAEKELKRASDVDLPMRAGLAWAMDQDAGLEMAKQPTMGLAMALDQEPGRDLEMVAE